MTPLTSPPKPTVTVRDTRDLLSAIPYLLGHEPDECVVIVCMGRDDTLSLIARIDLADLRHKAERTGIAQMVCARAVDVDTVTAWVVAYTSQGPTAIARARQAIRAFARPLRTDGVVTERCLVGEHRYWTLDCKDPLCCPPEGFSREGLRATAPAAQFVLHGMAPTANRDDLYRIPKEDQDRRNLAHRAATRWKAAWARAGDDDGAQRRWLEESLATWQDAVAMEAQGRPPGAAVVGKLSTAISCWRFRDIVLLWCALDDVTFAACDAVDTVLSAGSSAVVVDALAGIVDAAGARRPDTVRLDPAVAVLEAIVAHTKPQLTVAPLALLAFLAWWLGHGARAGYRSAQALAIDPEYRFAELIGATARGGVAPGWIRAHHRGE